MFVEAYMSIGKYLSWNYSFNRMHLMIMLLHTCINREMLYQWACMIFYSDKLKFVYIQVNVMLYFTVSPFHCEFESSQGLWILSCE